jgi:hypothetical protein
MKESSRSLVVRALNYWRQYHLETYVGLRYLARAEAVSDDASWLSEMLQRKAATRAGIRAIAFPRFKKNDSEGKAEYRSFMACSPINALIEVKLLEELSHIEGFQNRPNVYSYRWPVREREKRIFEYYWNGYVQKNQRIASEAAGLENSVVVIVDVKNFYPSLDRGLIRASLATIRDRAGLKHSQQNILADHFERSLGLVEGEIGLAIGPPTSHMLANIAMTSFDAALSDKFGRRYFRYVDDIAIVCERGVADSVLKMLRAQLGDIGLELNGDKTDIIDGAEWVANVAKRPVPDHDTLEGLIDEATLACALFPSRAEEFIQVCRDLNILLPERRFAARSQSARARRWLTVVVHKGIQSTVDASNLDAQRFKSRLLDVRRNLIGRAEVCFAGLKETASMKRRWQIQEQRYLLARLFYLTPLEDLKSLFTQIPIEPEFVEFRALVGACVSGSVDLLLKFPGPSIATFCSIADKLGTISISPSHLAKPSSASVASLSNLLISGALIPGKTATGDIPASAARLLEFARFRANVSRDGEGIDYLSELHALQLGFNRDATRELLQSRFDWEEDLALEALVIGSNGYSLA